MEDKEAAQDKDEEFVAGKKKTDFQLDLMLNLNLWRKEQW